MEIIKITEFTIDILRYKRNIFTRVVPALFNPVIIRIPYIKKNNIIIKPAINTLIIKSYDLTILIQITPVLLNVEIWCLTVYLFRRLGELTLIAPCCFGYSSVNLRSKIPL